MLTVVVSPDTVKSPVTTKSLPIVTTSPLSPIVTALEPKPPAKAVFKFATDTSSLVSVFVIAPVAAPKYAHCAGWIVVAPIFSNWSTSPVVSVCNLSNSVWTSVVKAPKYPHWFADIVVLPIASNCAPSAAVKLESSVTWDIAIVLFVSVWLSPNWTILEFVILLILSAVPALPVASPVRSPTNPAAVIPVQVKTPEWGL